MEIEIWTCEIWHFYCFLLTNGTDGIQEIVEEIWRFKEVFKLKFFFVASPSGK